MIIVTGGAGFIGSNLVHALVARGYEVAVVDDLTDGRKFRNIVDSAISDYWDKEQFYAGLSGMRVLPECVFHLGACSDTMEWDGREMMNTNFECSKVLLEFCLSHRIPFIYASSASVYGGGDEFLESPDCERPLNVYGYSKLLFDQYVRRLMPRARSQIVGLRYFNVYGPREAHKDKMASVAWHLHGQLQAQNRVSLFEGCDGYENGEQRRDFVYVGDVVDVNCWFMSVPDVSGIFNVGTGRSETFNAVAHAVIDWHGRGSVEYVPFPEKLRGRYQSFTQADLSKLREAGYAGEFVSVDIGVGLYLNALKQLPQYDTL